MVFGQINNYLPHFQFQYFSLYCSSQWYVRWLFRWYAMLHYSCQWLPDMLDYYSNHYKYKLKFRDFNMNPLKPEMSTFLNTENITNLIKENTCCTARSSCIDLILTNSKYSFQYSSPIDAGLSDHCHLIFSIMKTILAYYRYML